MSMHDLCNSPHCRSEMRRCNCCIEEVIAGGLWKAVRRLGQKDGEFISHVLVVVGIETHPRSTLAEHGLGAARRSDRIPVGSECLYIWMREAVEPLEYEIHHTGKLMTNMSRIELLTT
ncbi:hypothetical protein BE17_27360 [Sorangium cellulosum]|uniref:Uncharacterized protein n=1 Tax=Sorangium cellulosum TaxID=56 RepID=A0A150SFT3_SORCE|nr:hypothetical protein BE17_27360 [Sorangium cellulosum]